MSLVESMVDLVAERTQGRRVATVEVRVGALTGVVPEALEFCFDVATEGTGLAGARLVLDLVPGSITCRSCGRESPCPDRILLCDCGSADVAISGGEELTVTSVSLVKEQACV